MLANLLKGAQDPQESAEDARVSVFNNLTITTILAKSALFSHLSQANLMRLAQISKEIFFHMDTYLVHENDIAIDMYLIVTGKVEIIKQNAETKDIYRLAVLEDMDTIGEVALLDGNKRSASVRAIKPTHVIAINIEELRALAAQDPAFYPVITQLVKTLTAYIRATNAVTIDTLQHNLEEYKRRTTLGYALIAIIVSLCCYSLILDSSESLKRLLVIDSGITDLLMAIYVTTIIFFLRSTPYPLSFFGITLVNWRRHAWQGFLYTLPLIPLLIVLKIILIYSMPDFAQRSVFEFYQALHINASPEAIRNLWWGTLIFYVLIVALSQELIIRGGLQLPIQEFLTIPHKNIFALVFSNLVFATSHVIFSFMLTFATFLLGLYWGWIFQKQRSLVGSFVSHVTVGFVACWLIGFN